MLTTLVMIAAALTAAASVLAVALLLLARDRRMGRIRAVSGRRRELSERQRAELEAARLAVGAVRKHLESDEARFAGMEDPFSYVVGSIGAFVEALSAYDAATNGGG